MNLVQTCGAVPSKVTPCLLPRHVDRAKIRGIKLNFVFPDSTHLRLELTPLAPVEGSHISWCGINARPKGIIGAQPGPLCSYHSGVIHIMVLHVAVHDDVRRSMTVGLSRMAAARGLRVSFRNARRQHTAPN